MSMRNYISKYQLISVKMSWCSLWSRSMMQNWNRVTGHRVTSQRLCPGRVSGQS